MARRVGQFVDLYYKRPPARKLFIIVTCHLFAIALVGFWVGLLVGLVRKALNG
jgi:hypothetical protein